jgi:hypothetical protein
MKNQILRVFLLIIGLLFSPILLAAVACLLYILVKIIIGSSMSETIQVLKIFINSIIPFLPYITILPAAFFFLLLPLKTQIGKKLDRKIFKFNNGIF